VKSVSHTKGKGSSSWPTASARDWRGGYLGGRIRNGKVSMDTLDVAVQAYTKNGLHQQDQDNPKSGGNPQGSLPGKNWATPRSRDAGDWCMNKARVGSKREDTLTGQATERKTLGKLNPRWVEALMGLPIGWSMPSCTKPIGPWELVTTTAQTNSAA